MTYVGNVKIIIVELMKRRHNKLFNLRGEKMSKRNKKRSMLKKRKRKMNYNGIKAGDLVLVGNMQYKVVALKKQGLLILDNGDNVESKKCQKVKHK